MDQDDIAFLPVAQLARLIEARAVSPRELVDTYLARIERQDPVLRSYITVCGDAARADARAAEQQIAGGRYRGPLHGIPIAVKDQVATRGVRTTCGSPMLVDAVPEEDATAVARLKNAGAIVLGKSNMSEFAMGDAVRFPFGVPRNPWDLTRKPGSSSSGSAAATAAGLCAASLAEDTGGSVRGPATYTGLAGLRPTWGRVSRHGVQGLCWSMDTLGPLARSVEDCAILLRAVAGHDPRDPFSARVPVPDYREHLGEDLRGVRLGVVVERLYGSEDAVEPEILAAVVTAIGVLRDCGATVQDVSLPLTQHAALVSLVISMVDGTALHRERMQTRFDAYDRNVQGWLLGGSILPGQVYAKAQRVRQLIRRHVLAALETVDALVLPTSSTPAPVITTTAGTATKAEARARFTGGRNFFAPFNLAGVPAMSVPCGFTRDGLPIGLQIAGRPFAEDVVLRIAHAYQQQTEWHRRRPPERLEDGSDRVETGVPA